MLYFWCTIQPRQSPCLDHSCSISKNVSKKISFNWRTFDLLQKKIIFLFSLTVSSLISFLNLFILLPFCLLLLSSVLISSIFLSPVLFSSIFLSPVLFSSIFLSSVLISSIFLSPGQFLFFYLSVSFSMFSFSIFYFSVWCSIFNLIFFFFPSPVPFFLLLFSVKRQLGAAIEIPQRDILY